MMGMNRTSHELLSLPFFSQMIGLSMDKNIWQPKAILVKSKHPTKLPSSEENMIELGTRFPF
jgi:hypothetical protein